MRLLLKPWRALRTLGQRNLIFTAGVLSSLAAIEIVGHQCQSDWEDAILACGLAAVALTTVRYHGRSRLPWFEVLLGGGRFVRSVWRRYSFVVGIDLRCQPPIAGRCPGPIRMAVGVIAIWAVLMAMGASHFPADARALAVQVCYVGYLALLIALWCVLILGIAVGAFVPAAMIHDYFVSRHTSQESRPLWPELSCTFAYFGVIVLGSFLLPLWVVFILGFVPLVILLLVGFMGQVRDAQILWMYHREKTIWAVPLRSWIMYQATGVTLLAAGLQLVACGSAILGGESESETMPITAWLGQVLVWLAPGLVWSVFGQFVGALLRDPARPYRPALHVSGEPLGRDRETVLRFFENRGWKVSTGPLNTDPMNVSVQLVSEPCEPSDDASSQWPLRVTRPELVSEAVCWRLERRLQILQRRQLVSGLRKLYKIAARRKRAAGMGYWIAPHLWFIQGMSRDTEDKNLPWRESTILADTIGPHYHRVLGQAARHHAHEILRAVEVDIILVEDGVGFRLFCRVLRMLFEVYDIHGGRQRAQEMHFTGIPGVRVILHDYQLDNPFKSETYPEPDYQDLGRARILHIFRDRGEQEDPLEIPSDDTRIPVGSVPSGFGV